MNPVEPLIAEYKMYQAEDEPVPIHILARLDEAGIIIEEL